MRKFVVLFVIFSFLSCNSLSQYVSERNYRQVDLILEQKEINLNGFDVVYGIPLFKAIQNNDLQMINNLLDHGADINFRNERGNTPLFFAVLKWKKESIELLLERNADPYIFERNKNIPFNAILSSTQKPEDIIEMLDIFIRHGYDINFNESTGTALTKALYPAKIAILQYLLDKGADPNLRNKSGKTPMETAVRIYDDFRLKRNVYIRTPADGERVVKEMLDKINLLKQYGAK